MFDCKDKSRSAQGCRVASNQEWNSSAPCPLGAIAKVASRRLTPPWSTDNDGGLQQATLGKHWENTGETLEKHMEPPVDIGITTTAITAIHWKFEKMQQNPGVPAAWGCLGDQHIHHGTSREGIHVLVRVARSEPNHAKSPEASLVQIRTKLWAKLHPICWSLSIQSFESIWAIWWSMNNLWWSMNTLWWSVDSFASSMEFPQDPWNILDFFGFWHSFSLWGWAAPASAVISSDSTDLFERQSNNLTTLNVCWHTALN